MSQKTIKGHVVEKRYNPAKPDSEHAHLGRADDEFQLLLERHDDSEQVWVDVSENEYNAVQVGDTFQGGNRMDLKGFRGLRRTTRMTDAGEAAARGWIGGNVRGGGI